jgi:hypothetical protein
VAIRLPKDLVQCERFFRQADNPKHRQYEALRSFYCDNRPAAEVAKTFGYTEGSFYQLCHEFRNCEKPEFFITPKRGPQSQPKKDPARELVIAMRKQNYSVYEIADALKEKGIDLGPTAVGEILKEEGFAPLLRRTWKERPEHPRPVVEATADVRAFSLPANEFTTACGGLFLFVPDLVRLNFGDLAKEAGLPGSKMIPPEHALRSCLALKLWSIERKSHIMSLVADEGLALFVGLNAIPKKSYLSEYSSRTERKHNLKLLAAWHEHVCDRELFLEESFNLDFHSVPYFGEHEIVEKHYVSMRSRSQPSILAFLAQDLEGRSFCYSNADIRKGEEAGEILRFIDFWKSIKGKLPQHLVFDSQLTTYANLAAIDEMEIPFITLRRRSPMLVREMEALPASAWRQVELGVPNRKFNTPKYFDQKVKILGRTFRQMFVKDLGHDEPTVILTNEFQKPVKQVILRYAKRMLIENSLSDAVRFFHVDALSSSVGMKVDFDMSLLVMASGLYRLLAKRMRGYSNAQARRIFRDIIDIPATVSATGDNVIVNLHRRAHLPLILASGLTDSPVEVPWWHGRKLIITSTTTAPGTDTPYEPEPGDPSSWTADSPT